MAFIIVEGCDNTGKTTIAKDLAKRLGYKYVCGGGKDQGYYPKALELIEKDLPDKVQDRSFISELIYGPICRGECHIEEMEEMDLFYRAFILHNAVVVFCHRSEENLLNDFHNRPQMEGVEENIIEIQRTYQSYMDLVFPLPNPKRIDFDFEKDDFEELIKQIEERI